MYATVYAKVECFSAGLTWLRDSVAGTSVFGIVTLNRGESTSEITKMSYPSISCCFTAELGAYYSKHDKTSYHWVKRVVTLNWNNSTTKLWKRLR